MERSGTASCDARTARRPQPYTEDDERLGVEHLGAQHLAYLKEHVSDPAAKAEGLATFGKLQQAFDEQQQTIDELRRAFDEQQQANDKQDELDAVRMRKAFELAEKEAKMREQLAQEKR